MQISKYDFEVPLFALRRTVGVASATYNLISGLSSLNKTLCLFYGKIQELGPEFVRRAEQDKNIVLASASTFVCSIPSRFIQDAIFANQTHQSSRILYPNYFIPPRFPNRTEQVAAIIHDCQHQMYPQNFSAARRRWLDMQFVRTLRGAEHIFLISEFEKSQIARYYGDNLANRCSVIYNSIEWRRYERGEVSEWARKTATRKYILTVGDPCPHKNLRKLIRAFTEYAKKSSEADLVVVGRIPDSFKAEVESAIPEKLRCRAQFAGYVSDSDLGHLYKNASLFATASAYEGFGMPAVEAMGMAVPVLAASETALPEVTLGKAAYCSAFAPPDEWAEAMKRCLEHRKSTDELRNLAAEVRTRYSPTTVAALLLKYMDAV